MFQHHHPRLAVLFIPVSGFGQEYVWPLGGDQPDVAAKVLLITFCAWEAQLGRQLASGGIPGLCCP